YTTLFRSHLDDDEPRHRPGGRLAGDRRRPPTAAAAGRLRRAGPAVPARGNARSARADQHPVLSCRCSRGLPRDLLRRPALLPAGTAAADLAVLRRGARRHVVELTDIWHELAICARSCHMAVDSTTAASAPPAGCGPPPGRRTPRRARWPGWPAPRRSARS